MPLKGWDAKTSGGQKGEETMASQDLPTLADMTALNPAFRADPHAVLDDLRARCPVRHEPISGGVVLTRYEDVRAVVSDASLDRDPLKAELTTPMQIAMAGRVPEGEKRSETTSILMLDDPDHARIRRPLMQAFYARVAKVRPQVEALVDAVLDDLPRGEAFDLVADYCVPIPIDAIAGILGVDRERLGEFRQWSEDVIQVLNPFRSPEEDARYLEAGQALADYFLATMEARRSAPRDDLITDMVQLQAGGADISDAELRINLSALLIGGNLTTSDLIGNATRLLIHHPAEVKKLLDDPARINAVIEEVLRVEGPVDSTSRVSPKARSIGGCPVNARQPVQPNLRAANHDPAVFEDPHRFNPDRPHQPHVAFGGGSHICIGAPLARLEGQIAVLKLFQRFPHLAEAEPDAAPQWRSLPFFRGLERYPVIAG